MPLVMWPFPLPLVLSSLLCVGCLNSAKTNPQTLDKLARALRLQGIEWVEQKSNPIPSMPGRQWTGNQVLTGNGYDIELYETEGSKAFQAFLAVQVSGGRQVLAKEPFVAIVRKEPEAGVVKAAWEKVFP